MNLTKHWAAQLDDYVIDLAWSPVAGVVDHGSQLPVLRSPELAGGKPVESIERGEGGSDFKSQTLLAAASAAGPVSIFSAADGAKQHELPGHDQGTNCLAWQPAQQKSDGRGQISEGSASSSPASLSAIALAKADGHMPQASGLLATGGQDGTVKFWDAANGQHTATASLGKAWVEHLAWEVGRVIPNPPGSTEPAERRVQDSPPYLAASAGRDFVLLNPDASVRHAFKPAPKTVVALAWQPQGGCVAVAYFGDGVCLWDADDFIAQKEFSYANGIHALVWSPDSKWLVSENQDPA